MPYFFFKVMSLLQHTLARARARLASICIIIIIIVRACASRFCRRMTLNNKWRRCAVVGNEKKIVIKMHNARIYIVINCMDDLCVAHMRPGQTYNIWCKGKSNNAALLLGTYIL